MMPGIVGGKRLREDYEDDIAQTRDAVLQGLARQENVDTGLREVIADLPQDTQDLLVQSPTELVQHLKNTLQHLITAAQKSQEPLFSYKVNSSSQPAAQTLLKIATGLCHSGALQTGEVFGLILDVVETTRVEDVKACFNFMDSLWGTWSTLQAVAHRLAFQKVYNMFCRRISNNQDAEVLGAVASVVAKMMPFNDPAGLNTAFQCNQHQTPMDESIGASVDGSDPVDLPFYQQLWELQSLFQQPHDQTAPEQWAKAVSGIQVVLNTLKSTPIGVASRTTAVPQDRGKSVIVKYLTSSKLTRLQLRDAAFRRTLLLQCLVLLHACAHPIAKKPNPIGTAGPKTVVPPLKEKQLAELRDAETQLYEELIKTPQQGEAFAEVIKTILDRETAFVKWKADGATAFWEQAAAAPKTAVSLDRGLPAVAARRVPDESQDMTAPDTALDLSRMWDNSGVEEDLYRKNRDSRMLPTADEYLAQVGKEISGDVRPIRQYANAKAPGGVDALYLFRAQRMLQRKDLLLWHRTAQIDAAGQRLENAFADLYPEKMPSSWKRHKVDEDKSQNGPKRGRGKAVVRRAVSGTIDDEAAGDKPLADTAMTEAQPLNEDSMQADVDEKARQLNVVAEKEAGKISAEADAVAGICNAEADKAADNAPIEVPNTAKTEETASMPKTQIESEQNMPETDHFVGDAVMTDTQGAKPDPSVTDAAADAVASTVAEAPALADAGPATQEHPPTSPELPTKVPAETLPKADTKAETVTSALDSAKKDSAASNDVRQEDQQNADSKITSMDE